MKLLLLGLLFSASLLCSQDDETMHVMLEDTREVHIGIPDFAPYFYHQTPKEKAKVECQIVDKTENGYIVVCFVGSKMVSYCKTEFYDDGEVTNCHHWN